MLLVFLFILSVLLGDLDSSSNDERSSLGYCDYLHLSMNLIWPFTKFLLEPDENYRQLEQKFVIENVLPVRRQTGLMHDGRCFKYPFGSMIALEEDIKLDFPNAQIYWPDLYGEDDYVRNWKMHWLSFGLCHKSNVLKSPFEYFKFFSNEARLFDEDVFLYSLDQQICSQRSRPTGFKYYSCDYNLLKNLLYDVYKVRINLVCKIGGFEYTAGSSARSENAIKEIRILKQIKICYDHNTDLVDCRQEVNSCGMNQIYFPYTHINHRFIRSSRSRHSIYV